MITKQYKSFTKVFGRIHETFVMVEREGSRSWQYKFEIKNKKVREQSKAVFFSVGNLR